MMNTTTATRIPLFPSIEAAWQDVDSSFDRFCLTAGIGAIEHMLCEDARQLTGEPHSRDGGRVGHRWGRTKGKIGFHGGKVAVHRPRVRNDVGPQAWLADVPALARSSCELLPWNLRPKIIAAEAA